MVEVDDNGKVAISLEGSDDVDVFEPEVLVTADGPKTVWAIGNGYWCWDEVTND